MASSKVSNQPRKLHIILTLKYYKKSTLENPECFFAKKQIVNVCARFTRL